MSTRITTSLILLTFFMTGCSIFGSIPTRNTAASGRERAQEALADYFASLNRGDYGQAEILYGGSTEILQGNNPDVDPEDILSLLRNACEINGFQCLPVRSIEFLEHTQEGEYLFEVTFFNQEGELFIRGPCCGSTDASETQSVFRYRVVQGKDGDFRVMDLPPYVP